MAVFLAALLTALATGLGAAPFFLARSIERRWLGLASAAAAGFMLAASTALLWEGGRRGPLRLVAGALLGALVVALTRRVLARRRDVLHLGAMRGADAFKAIGIVAVMTVHSVTEGVGVGVSYGDGKALGVFITAAIAVHNIPEGLAISLVLVPRGTRPLAAAWWSVFSSLPQPLLAVPAFLFVESFSTILPMGLGFAAGAMAWMVVSELLPEARATASGRSVALVLGLAFVAMMGLQALLLAA
jgi:ZIP family zinc transporter